MAFAYYNEFDPEIAAWLRELIYNGLIAPGLVDERSIEDVLPSDLVGFSQHHFFAGIGVWSYSLRRAGWPDDRPIWTGSCPCQPFSAAGKGKGVDDPRHLWPAWAWLIDQYRPSEIFGEQVARKDGRAWFDLVSADLEGMGYACAAVDTCSAGHGAPHIRQRLRFAAYNSGPAVHGLGHNGGPRLERYAGNGDGSTRWPEQNRPASETSSFGRLGNPDCTTSERFTREVSGEETEGTKTRSANGGYDHGHPNAGQIGRMADDNYDRRKSRSQTSETSRLWCSTQPVHSDDGHVQSCPTNGFWRNADWLLCADPDGPRWRPVEPGTFPLAHGAPARMVQLRGYGNALDAEATQTFIEAYQETRSGVRPATRNDADVTMEDLLS